MRKSTKTVDIEKLPVEVLSNIFIRLLARQLAQMRCVSKYWNAILCDSEFIKSHLHHSVHKNDEDILLFFKRNGSFESNPGPSAARASGSPDVELTDLIKLELPVDDPQHKKAQCYVIGSVNGLVCIAYASNKKCYIRIWNPSLSASLTLPPYSLCHDAAHMGFGFDPKNDDYKVVRVASSFREPNMVSQPQSELYSMRKGSWELISHRIPPHIKQLMGPNTVCLDGRLHCICVTDMEQKPDTIMTYDLSAMTYGEIPLPHPITASLYNGPYALGVLDGKLCVTTTNSESACEVWVMDGEESWVKRHIFSQFKCFMNPYGFTSRNEFLFQVDDGPRFVLCDPIAANNKYFKIKWARQFDVFKVVQYVDSLVWIASPPPKLAT